MHITIDAVFDGEVFRPESSVDIKPNTRCVLTIEDSPHPDQPAPENAWQILERLAGTVDGPEDWAAEHDHYISGTPKRSCTERP
jgi:hypothetical protein